MVGTVPNDDRDVLVRLIGLSIGHQPDDPLIADVDLSLGPGEVAVIGGRSGIGKTTLLRTIAGLVPPLAGHLEVVGVERPQPPPRGVLGYIPQQLGLVRHSSVFRNVLMGGLAGHASKWWPFSKLARARAHEAIDAMGLASKTDEPVRLLSGGQQRRVAIARALAQRPRVLLADEFLSELDPETMVSTLEAIDAWIQSSSAALIMVEHEPSRARDLMTRSLIVRGGRLIDSKESTP